MAQQMPPDTYFTLPYMLTKSMHRDVYPAIDPKNPALSAEGKVIIVTGAGGGLGAAIGRAWATAGAHGVVLVGRKDDSLQITAEQISKISSSVAVLTQAADIANESSVKALFAAVKAKFGKAHVLVNAAATVGGGPIGDAPLGSWWQDFEVNTKGVFLLARDFIQSFGAEGTIMNLVSTAMAMGAPGMSSYSTSKLAATKLTQALSLEYPKIRAYSLHPGIVAAEDRGMVIDAFTPFAKDTQVLTGGFTLWLATAQADAFKGGFLTSNWDVEEMKAHEDEIVEGKLLELAFLNAKLGPEGHPWK